MDKPCEICGRIDDNHLYDTKHYRKFTSLIHYKRGGNFQSDYGRQLLPNAQQAFKRDCEQKGVAWGILVLEDNGAVVSTYP